MIKGDLKITAHSIVRKKALEEAFQSVLPLAFSHDGAILEDSYLCK